MFKRFRVYALRSGLAGLFRTARRQVPLVLLMLLPLAGSAQEKDVTLNFKDADIRAFISTVSDITGKNFIVDPRINGRVTIISSRPMDKEEIYKVFESVLEVNGFATVKGGGNTVKIIPDANAKFEDIDTATGENPGEGDEIITRIVELQNVQAAQLVPILRPLASPQAHMAAFPQTNMLIIADRAATTDRLVKIIRNIDKPSSEDVEIIRLQHAAAAELVRILTSLEQQGQQADPTAPKTNLIADERTNSILLSGDKPNRLRLRALISHLDTAVDDGGGNVHVVYLRYAKAADLAGVLTGNPTSSSSSSQGLSSSDTGFGSVGSAGDANGVVSPVVQQQIVPTALPGQTGGSGGGFGGGQNGGSAIDKVELSIVADEATNALVITASASQFAAIQSVIRQLDIRRAQVVVEAVIAEISEDKAKELGVQLRFLPGSFDGPGVITGTNLPTAADPGGINALSTATGLANIGSGFTLGVFDGVTTLLGGTQILNLGVLIRALASDSDTNVLSTPTLVTQDNQEAEIVVGQNVPFLTGSFANSASTGTANGGVNAFQTVDRQDIGVKLKIKPQINEGDAVTLDIAQEVSSIAPSAQGATDIITNKRSIKTSVTIDDGSFIVLGGLITDNVTESVQKVPVLGDIPLLGVLFRNTRTTRGKTNLMVFLHPVIVRNAGDGSRISSSKYNYIRAQQLDKDERGIKLYPNDRPPLLPPLQQFLAPASADDHTQPAPTIPKRTDPQPLQEDRSGRRTDSADHLAPVVQAIPGWR